MNTGTGSMVSDQQFHAQMAAFSPFEGAPHLAVAVSGGSDSMALVRLAHIWCRAVGGRLSALTVDHGLRSGSDDEARRVAQWMEDIGVAHTVLPWTGPKPPSGHQRAAREARYRLMDTWCRDHGVLHLLVGHTADDQAETLLLRLRRNSGPDGLAGMPAVRELASCRILRPLLRCRRENLRRYLRSLGQEWIEDPSNEDDRFGRTAARRLIASGEFSVTSLCRSAGDYGRLRVVAEQAADVFLAERAQLHPAGFVHFERAGLASVPEDTVLRALGRVLSSVGGGQYAPPLKAVRSVGADLMGDGEVARTLGNCRVFSDRGRVTVCREARNMPSVQRMIPGTSMVWDNRIAVRCLPHAGQDLTIRTANSGDWAASARLGDDFNRWRLLPQPVRESLPVIAGPAGVFSAPLLKYNLGAPGALERQYPDGVFMAFRPRRALSIAGFYVANRE